MPAWPYPKLVAHRGAGRLAPENTLAAFRLGYAHGYRMAEFDVKLSADGIAFLLHDATLDRTTSGKGRADALTWRELSQLDAGSWHSPAYAGEVLPTLAAVAGWSRANGVAVNIEIKPSPGRERESGAAVALDARSLWSGADVMPLLSSFSETALDSARDAVPELPRALLGDQVPPDWRDRVARLGCIAVDVDHKILTRERVEEFHGAGLRVATWTVNEPARVAELLAWGVDSVITDAVDVIPPR
ncbi:MAG TPA: glycerophosphodiester phosphodiesterase [Casimicrobiaceae bacterium]|nr:glycerophosphodiester phosphodiesterase [Casimicrobiaceae bacterium]